MRQTTSLLLLALAMGACGRITDAEERDQTPASQGGRDVATNGGDAAKGGAAGSGASGSPTLGGAGTAGGSTAGGITDTGGASSMGGVSATGGASTAGAAAEGGALTAGAPGGGAGPDPTAPYAPRSGKFGIVALSRTKAYRHSGSIATGAKLLDKIAHELGADLLVTETTEFLEQLDRYELVFFMNTSGSIFTEPEKAKFEAWMRSGGAFCGTHSATDTEFGWSFYKEVVGQNYQGHSVVGTPDSIVFEAGALDHPAVLGLPNPWPRVDEWMRFDLADEWTGRPGFKILARKQSDQLPIAWVREYGGFRAFYTGIGHDAVVFEDPNVEKHLTGGILWTVRRERCLASPKPEGCLGPG